jgi:hypothetical protein
MAVLPSIDSPTALYPGPPRSDLIEPDPDEALAPVRRRIGLADRLHSLAAAAAEPAVGRRGPARWRYRGRQPILNERLISS